MSSYTDALKHYSIENAAFQVDINDLRDLPTPLITLLNVEGGIFTIIKSLSNERITWLDKNHKWTTSNLSEFAIDWSGQVLYAEPNSNSGEQDYKIKRRRELLNASRIPLIISLILVVLTYLVLNTTTNSLLSLLLIKFVGVIFATFLFIKSVDLKSTFVEKICTLASESNCQTILESPAAKITSWLSWVDVGFIYFFGSFIGLLLSNGTLQDLNSFLAVQAIFSAGAVLFSIYSLYYQKFKAKTWCTLCLGIVATLIIESSILLGIFSDMAFGFKLYHIIIALVGFSIPSIFLLLFRVPLTKGGEVEKIKGELKSLKTNPKIFKALMSGQSGLPDINNLVPRLFIGNPKAEHTITFLSNPLCNPCTQMHLKIRKLLISHTNFKCEIIFLSNPDPKDLGGKFVRKLFSLPEKLRAKAMYQWYSSNDKNFAYWNQAYASFKEEPTALEMQVAHNNLIRDAEIKGTPAIFINGTLLHEVITVDDLPSLSSHINRGAINHGFANQ